MRDLTKIAPSLFDKIRTRFPSITIGDEKAKRTTEPAKGRFFNFDFVIDQINFGNITVALTENALKIYFSRQITRQLDSEQRKLWYNFLRNMRIFAKQNVLKFDARDISRDNLNINDLRSTISTETTLESIQRSRIRVNRVTAEGRDYNKIKSIYVENSQGERFKLPINNMTYAHALVPHLEAGGNIYDDYGTHVRNLVKEKHDLERFARYGARADYLSESGQNLVQEARARSQGIGQLLKKLRHDSYYQTYHNDNFDHDDEPLDENLVRLRELFVRPTVDPRVDAALPHLHRLNVSETFEQWVDQVIESVTELPNTDQEFKTLHDLFAEELPLGVDGINAITALQDLLSSDELESSLESAAESDPNADARPIVYDWLAANLPKITKLLDYEKELPYNYES